ncbi:hypothetical protein VTN31DRAFT_4570 [Thermomyces dupontii]|uniref:uncharacterized protein n=1 Tax=Talaromyces thermophilus TaxID=28565 RepID=UPI0037430164
MTADNIPSPESKLAMDSDRDDHPEPKADGDKSETAPDQQSSDNGETSSASSEAETGRDAASLGHTMSRISTDQYGNTYPEGGLEAYLVVLGSFMGLFGSLGLVNTIGTFQAYLTRNQLRDHSDGAVGWIFGVYNFLVFFGGIQVGPVFDAKGPRLLVPTGSVLVVLSMILVGFCTKYWQFMLVLGILNGLGTTLIFTPVIAAVGHFFLRKRGMATGLAATGGSLGGIAFPFMLQSLFPKVGFAWATRAVALVCFVTCGIACILVRSRLPSKPASKENILPDFRIFRNAPFTATTWGIFLIEWGLFIPLAYISSYALATGFSESFSYQILAILNAGSVVGRALPGFVADYVGRYNAMIVTVLGCMLTTACLWLPAGDNKALLIVYALLFGFFSGSNIGLTPVCIGQLCKTENYGRYYATSYTIVSLGTLTGIPIAGEILTHNNGDYWGLITFTAACYFAGVLTFMAAKGLAVGWKQPWAVF